MFSFEETNCYERESKAFCGVSIPSIPTRLLCSLTSQLDLCHERLEKGGIEKGQSRLFCRDTYTDDVLWTLVSYYTPDVCKRFSSLLVNHSFLQKQSHSLTDHVCVTTGQKMVTLTILCLPPFSHRDMRQRFHPASIFTPGPARSAQWRAEYRVRGVSHRWPSM